MNEETANNVYDVLVATVGARAHDDARHEFVYHQTSDHPPDEFRFQGRLGFGGKFWRRHDRWDVTCYREDETDERRNMIQTANAILAPLFKLDQKE